MATYAVGDLHGNYAALRRLLRRIRFDRKNDRLWLVGDLVNRGPGSLEVLRWASDIGDRLTVVLGNHDLHLLAVAAGWSRPRRQDTFAALLEAPDRDELLAWLRQRPLLHHEGDFLMVHAGLLPSWKVKQAERLARSTEKALRGKKARALLAGWRREPLPTWSSELPGSEKRRVALAAFTLMRVCRADGTPVLSYSGAPCNAPKGLKPWFDLPARRSAMTTVITGHWAALGLHLRPGLWALDSGAAWGGFITAVRLEDRVVYQEPCWEAQAKPPAGKAARGKAS